MQEIIRLILFYLSGIWRYRWSVLIIAAILSPIGWAFVATMPDEYRSSARVYVDTESVLTPLLHGLAVRVDDERRVRMMTNVLFSRENLEKLARMTDMDLQARTPEDMDTLVADLRSRARLEMAGDNIYTISFRDESPDLTRRVVQAMLTIFVESNLGSARQDQDSAERFLQREIKDYERRLIEAERKIKDFRMRNLDLISDKGSHFDRLRSAREELVEATDELALARSRRDELHNQLDFLESQGATLPGFQVWVEESSREITTPLDLQLVETEGQIEEMLLRYTERHPDIIALRQSVERLRQQRDRQREEFIAEQRNSEVAVAQSLERNPIYQEMRLRVADAESEVVVQQTRVAALRDKIDQFQAAVDEVFQIEAEEQQLSRDHAILHSNHQALVERMERARLTREVDTSVDTVRFRTLDPPKVPQEPSAPNRIALSSGVFGGSLTLGIGFAFLLAQLRPVFFDRRQLAEISGVPVIGSVNMVWVARQQVRHTLGNLSFLLLVLFLLAAYAAVLTIFILRIDPLQFLPF